MAPPEAAKLAEYPNMYGVHPKRPQTSTLTLQPLAIPAFWDECTWTHA